MTGNPRSAILGLFTACVVAACADSSQLVAPARKAASFSVTDAGVLGTFTLSPPANHVDGTPQTSTGITLPSGVPVRVTVSGKMDFTPNPAWLTCFGPYPPLSLTSVGPSGFPPAGDFSVQVGEGSATGIQPGAFLAPGPRHFSSDTAGIDLLGGGGVLWVRRSGVSETCGNTPAYLVSGSQLVVVRNLQKTLHVTVAVSPQDIAPPLNPRCRGTPGEARVSVNASWSDGSSAQGLTVSLRTQFEGGSGGHAHQADDRDGFGHFAQSSGQTDASGSFSTDYVPDSIGAVERLTATVSGEAQTATASADVATRVPGLSELVSGANVELGGATPDHPRNTFGTGFTIGKIVILADTFFQVTGFRIPYNDMSLEFGGVFDLNAEFTATAHPGHLGHRCGQEVDVVDKVGDRLAALENYLDVLAYSPLIRASEVLRHAAGSYHLRFAR